MPSLISTPQNICILRLSAIGDTCHVVPVLRTLQQAWPEARFTWVIGALESRLMSALPEVEFITVDKRASRAARRALARRLRGPALRCAAAHAAGAAREPDRAADPGHRQTRIRSAARPRTAVAVHQPAHRRARARTRPGQFLRIRRGAGRARSACCAGICRSRRRAAARRRSVIPDARAHAHHQPLLQPHAAQLERRTLCRGGRPRRRGCTACR